jgi:hypothetical protein
MYHHSANWGNTSSLKLLQFQVEAAKKRQQMSLNAAAAANASSNLKVSILLFVAFCETVISSYLYNSAHPLASEFTFVFLF